MMTNRHNTTTYLADYTPPAYLVEQIHLEFQLQPTETRVHARMSMQRNPESTPPHPPLSLDGRELELCALLLDGHPLQPEHYSLTDEQLIIHTPPTAFELTIETRIQPDKNRSLEGLYRSGTLYCTQCEAEGFRKITYYPDRPDVMARFTVTLEADQTSVPILLSNGNLKQSGTRPNNRHFATWEDPFPKPCYLFAVVAGNLVCQQDHFITASGRDITLQLWVEPENINKCQHAMESLKKAMRWDEQRFGREYDLDLYMIVAVNDFNMGAMENKGLNLFNTQYLLADAETATDSNYEEIESVIGHEYFHNWSGNRITCRDWFQLSLKEGLTIFRDQEFSADLGSPAVQRIRDVQTLRSYQFPEDAGPTAHAVRPDSYMEINNFYTVTIYNKGAEVVRMLQTLIGRETFRYGMDLYFARHDGQAVTVEAFIAAMEAASNRDLSQFRYWYQQVGTPELTFDWHHDPQFNQFELTVKQACRQTPAPLHIPVTMALLHPTTGHPLPMALTTEQWDHPPPTERTLELTHTEHRFCFTGLTQPPIPSILRGFSAPVKIQAPLSTEDLAFLWGYESDPFNRWDAGQKLATQLLLQAAQNPTSTPITLSPLFQSAFAATLTEKELDPALIALALTLPSLNLLVENMTNANPTALHQARESIRQQLASSCQELLLRSYTIHQTPEPYQRDAHAMGCRALKNVALNYLLALPEANLPAKLAIEQIRTADNMTDRLGGLVPLVQANRPESRPLLAEMEQKWLDNPLAMNKWFAIQAAAPIPEVLTHINHLMTHKRFDIHNPNNIRALIGTFCRQNLAQFHDPSGSGYQFLVEQIATIDPTNPQIAARLAGAFSRWRQFEPGRKQAMQNALEQIMQIPTLSRNTYEIVSKSLI